MKKFLNSTDFLKPIISDNRHFREDIPVINAYFEASKKEGDSFPKEDGIVKDSKLVDFCNCPICGSDKNNKLFVKYGFAYVECIVCSHVFVHNRLKEKILLDLYSKSITDQLNRKVQESKQYHDYWTRIYSKYLLYAQKNAGSNKNLLDVGCGSGKFLAYCAENYDYILHAIDFCKDTFEQITSLVGRENYYFQKKIEDIDFGGKKFGLITFWGVLEHVTNPAQMLRKCRDILDEEGIIIILIPNLHSRAFKILGIDTPSINPREHINFYTEKSFAFLCKETNLLIADFFQELPVIDLMHQHIDYSERLIDDILSKKESYYRVYILRKND